jgi:hypothetical protein
LRTTWLLAIFSAAASLASGDLLSFSTGANTAVCMGSSTAPFCTDVLDGNSSSTSASLAGTFTSNFDPLNTETVNASARASYGVLDAGIVSTFNVNTPESVFASANAFYEDILTMTDPSNPSLNGQAGTLDLSYSLDGSVMGSAFAVVITESGTSLQQQTIRSFDSSFDGTITIPVDFVWGQAFGLYQQLSVGSGNATGYGVLTEKTGSGSGTADFSHTLVLTALQPVDANGNPISGVVITSASGTQYTIDGVVPEPSTLIPLLLTAFGISVVQLRRTKNARESRTRRPEFTVSMVGPYRD